MILSWVLIFILICGFFVGLRRGFIMQSVHLIANIIAFIVARMYNNELSEKLKLWIPFPHIKENSNITMFFQHIDMEEAYYRAIAFVLLFIAVKIVLRIIGSALNFLASIPVLRQLNGLAGGVLGFVETYIIVFILLFVGALLPIESVQHAIAQSGLSESVIKHTPYLSSTITNWLLKQDTSIL